MCSCSANVSVFDDTCGDCGADLDHPCWSPWPARETVARVLKIALAATILLGVPTAVVLYKYARRSRVDRWQVGGALDAAAAKRDWASARVYARQLVDMDSDNANGWFMLAFTGRKLGMHARVLIQEAREAVRHDPTHGPASFFLAAELARLGDVAEAREHANVALEWSQVPDGVWRLAGELELARVRPDLERALELFERGYARGVRDPVLTVRAALVRLNLVGVVAPERYPAELTIALQRAHDALVLLGRSADAGLAHWFEAEVAFADGRLDDAWLAAVKGLDNLPEVDASLVAGRLHVVAGRIALARGDAAQAIDEFHAALTSSTAPEIVDRVTTVLTLAAMLDRAADLLRDVADADESGTVHAALADQARAAGELDEALRFAQRAMAAAPSARAYRILAGDIHRDAGRYDDAAREYGAVLSGGGDTVSAEIRLAMLELHDPARIEADGKVSVAERAIERLATMLETYEGAVPVELALADACLAAERPMDAVRHLERVLARRPWSPETWLLLSEARRATSGFDPTAGVRAADAAREAARIRPFDRRIVAAATRAFARAGDDLDAISCASIFLSRTADDVEILRLRADSRIRRREWTAAVADLERAMDLGDGSVMVRMQLADAYVRTGHGERALALLRDTTDPSVRRAVEFVLASHESFSTEAPESFESAPARAIFHVRAGEIGLAVAALRSAIDADPRDTSAARALVFILTGAEIPGMTRDERMREAEAVATQLGRAGGEAMAVLLEGRLLAAGGDAEAALAPLRRAAEMMPWDTGAQFEFAETLLATQDLPRAAERYRAAAWLPGGRETHGVMIAARLFEIAMATGDPALRERLLADALRANVALVPAAETLAKALITRGAWAEAAEVAEVTLAALPPRDPSTAGLLRIALAARVETGDSGLAARHLDALEGTGDEIERADTTRGLVLLQGDRAAKAIPFFRAAIQSDPSDLLAALGLTEALLRMAEVEEVHEFVSARLMERPGDTALSRVVTRSMVRLGLGASALREARGAVERDARDVGAVRQLVWVLGIHGEGRAALDAVERAIARAGDDVTAATGRPSATDTLRETDTPRDGAPGRGVLEALAAETLTQLVGEPARGLERARVVVNDPGVSAAARLAARIVVAESLAELGRTSEAGAICDELQRGWKDDRPQTADDARIEPRVRFVMGLVAVRTGRIEIAAELFLRVARLDSSNHAAANNAAWCIVATSPESTLALDLAVRATTMAPALWTYWDTRALCERGSGLWDAAAASWERAEGLLAEASDGADGAADDVASSTSATTANAVAARARMAAERAETLADLGRRRPAREAAALSLKLAPHGPESSRASKILSR